MKGVRHRSLVWLNQAAPLDHGERLQTLVLLASAMSGIVYWILFFANRKVMVLNGDFSIFYAAGRFALANLDHAWDIYDPDVFIRYHSSLFDEAVTSRGPFLYPPAMLLLLLPLQGLDIDSAYLVWGIGVFACVLLACRALRAGAMQTAALSLSPLVTYIATFGQNAALFLLALSAGIVAFRRSAPVLAGLFLSLTCLKPHFVIIALLFLVVFDDRKAATGFMAGVLVQLLVPVIVFGPEIMTAYLMAMAKFSNSYGVGSYIFSSVLLSAYALMKYLNFNDLMAYAVHALSVLAGLAIFARRKDFIAACAVGILIPSYNLPTSLVILAIPAILLAKAGETQISVIFLAIYSFATVAITAGERAFEAWGMEFPPIVPVLLWAAVMIYWYRTRPDAGRLSGKARP